MLIASMSQSNITRLDKKNHSQQKLSTLKRKSHTASKKSSEYLVLLGFQGFLNIGSLKTNKFSCTAPILYLAKKRDYLGPDELNISFLHEGCLGESLSWEDRKHNPTHNSAFVKVWLGTTYSKISCGGIGGANECFWTPPQNFKMRIFQHFPQVASIHKF